MGRVLQVVSDHAGTDKTHPTRSPNAPNDATIASSALHSNPLLASRLVQLAAGCSDASAVDYSILSHANILTIHSIDSRTDCGITLSQIQQRLKDENTDSCNQSSSTLYRLC
jgi:hypothetical protein